MENDLRIKKINAKEEVEFAIILVQINGEDIDITPDSDNDELPHLPGVPTFM